MTGRCPICRADVRRMVCCARCGADLTAILKIQHQARRQRVAGRQAFAEGRFAEAAHLWQSALNLEEHPPTRRLQWLATCLADHAEARMAQP